MLIYWRDCEPPEAYRDRRLLLIGQAQNTGPELPEADVCIGHWHEGEWGFVPVRQPGISGDQPRHRLRVLHWAELKEGELPTHVRGLSGSDFKG